MEDFNFQVDLKGVISLLSNHLYSREDVFIRELLQNGVDAISARQQIEKRHEGHIEVEYIDSKEEKEIIFKDNGIGLTQEEIHQFLAIIGQSSKREIEMRESFIGQFGIGLLSCFLVSDSIEVMTCSAKSLSSYRWVGYSDGTYTVTDIPDYGEIGTRIRLKLKKDIVGRFDRWTVSKALIFYGFLLPIPIKFYYRGRMQIINDIPIPWRQEVYTKGDIMEFGELVFQEKFLDAVQIEEEGIHGYAYISASPLPVNETAFHKIYLRSMFLTEDGRDLIPKWASFAHFLLDVRDLTPTASREGLQRDGKLYQVRNKIQKYLLNYLIDLTRFDLAKMKQLAEIHNLTFKAFATDDDKVLKLLFPFLVFSTNKGRLTGAQILEAAKKIAVFYCIDIDTYRRTAPLLEYSKSLLINGGYIYEASILSKLASFNPTLPIKQFEDNYLEQIFEEPNDKEIYALKAFFQEATKELISEQCKPIIKRLYPCELPALFVEGAENLLLKDENSVLDCFSFLEGLDSFEQNIDIEPYSSLYLNCDNKLIQSVSKVTNSNVMRAVARILYIQARLAAHYSLSAKELEKLSSGLKDIIDFGLRDDF